MTKLLGVAAMLVTALAALSTAPAVTASPGVLAASPKQLNFGSQPVGSQTTETVTVTNTGTETVTIIGAILQGGPVFDWNQAQVDLNTCAMVVGTLAPGASCTAPILFAPTEQGHFRGNLILEFQIGGVTQPFLTIRLLGTAR
jgi:hypothetical protein